MSPTDEEPKREEAVFLLKGIEYGIALELRFFRFSNWEHFLIFFIW